MRASNTPFKAVITGGPGVGKTTTIRLLARRFPVFREAARLVLTRNRLFRGKTAVEARGLAFQTAIWRLQGKHFQRANRLSEPWIFFDRGIPDSMAYLTLSEIPVPAELAALAEQNRYDAVFVLEPLPFYAPDKLRTESHDEAEALTRLIFATYVQVGYQPIRIPCAPVDERVRQIFHHCELAFGR